MFKPGTSGTSVHGRPTPRDRPIQAANPPIKRVCGSSRMCSPEAHTGFAPACGAGGALCSARVVRHRIEAIHRGRSGLVVGAVLVCVGLMRFHFLNSSNACFGRGSPSPCLAAARRARIPSFLKMRRRVRASCSRSSGWCVGGCRRRRAVVRRKRFASVRGSRERYRDSSRDTPVRLERPGEDVRANPRGTR